MEDENDKPLKGTDGQAAGEDEPRAANTPAPTPAPSPLPSADILNFLQQRITELEKRLYDTQEKALMFSVELKGREEAQRTSVRQAEEIFEKLREKHRASEQERSMTERLAQMEQICRRLEACEGRGNRGNDAVETQPGRSDIGAVPPAGPSAAEPAADSESALSEQPCQPGTPPLLPAEKTEGGQPSGTETKPREIGSTRDALALLSDRMAMIESRLSLVTAGISEVAARIGLREKLNSNDFAALRERIEKLEKSAAPQEYQAQIEKKLAALENDLTRVKESEGPMVEAVKKIEEIEMAVRSSSRERTTAAENRQLLVAAIEDLRVKFTNMSILFEQIRMWMVAHRKK